MLPKAVESAVVEQHVGTAFRVGVAEVNGWRNSMEDAHVIHMADDWGFFGVFDGHGGDQCSAFVSDRIHKRLCKHACPATDAALKKLCLDVDKEFLDSEQDSGSTGTMCIVHLPARSGGRPRLRIANVGDSRVLLGQRSGGMISGSGTDQGLTTDHKPDNPSERQRIYRTGGFVQAGEMGGPVRVNGELAVSRCFGDARFKETGGPGPEDHPVIADPELGHLECNESDFLLLVCDGISEGDFPNAAVVRMVAAHLRSNDDPGEAARAVCMHAIEAGSKDNVTCMVVLMDGSKSAVQEKKEFIPGQLSSECLTNKAYITAYEGMAKRGGFTLAQAAELRYDTVSEALAKNERGPPISTEMRAELDAIGKGVPPKGSSKRSAWFRNWEEKLPGNFKEDESESAMMRLMMAHQAAGGGGCPPLPDNGSGRRVTLPDLVTLRTAVNEHKVLEWDERMMKLAGAEGQLLQDDPSDGTSRVNCAGFTVWLPTSILVEHEEGSAKGQLRGAASAAAPPAATTPSSHLPPRLAAVAKSGPIRRSPRPEGLQGGALGSSPPAAPGARSFGAGRLPVLPSAGGSAVGGNRTPSPGMRVTGNRASQPGAAAAGMRSSQSRFRSPSPIDGAAAAVCAANPIRGEASGGRMSRSLPARR